MQTLICPFSSNSKPFDIFLLIFTNAYTLKNMNEIKISNCIGKEKDNKNYNKQPLFLRERNWVFSLMIKVCNGNLSLPLTQKRI